jgi:hypothetical protein
LAFRGRLIPCTPGTRRGVTFTPDAIRPAAPHPSPCSRRDRRGDRRGGVPVWLFGPGARGADGAGVLGGGGLLCCGDMAFESAADSGGSAARGTKRSADLVGYRAPRRALDGGGTLSALRYGDGSAIRRSAIGAAKIRYTAIGYRGGEDPLYGDRLSGRLSAKAIGLCFPAGYRRRPSV